MYRVHVATLLCVAACGDSLIGNKPVGGNVDTVAELQRYLRRANLDLAGHVPSDADLATSTSRLVDGANTPATREAMVDEMIARDTFGTVWIGELENGIFGGNTVETQYATVCGLIRATALDCMACTGADSCACTCPEITPLATERAQLRLSPTDFGAGTKSSTIERRYAAARGYYVLAGSPEGRVKALFDDFLSRTAEPDETENGRAMIFGSLLPGSPAGLMFHRYGASYDDLIDIIFDSEPYREAIVRRVFQRYLARDPSPVELAHFVATLDANEPDARGLVRAVVSSREYFDQ